jgi:hypothetical protein
MRRFLTYFNALLLGVILGMVFLAIVHAVPVTSAVRTSSPENAMRARTKAASMRLVKSARQASYVFREWERELQSGR